MNVFRSCGVRRAATATLMAAGLTAGVLAASPGAAHAATDRPVAAQGTQAYWITAPYDGQNIAVADASEATGARLIQWNNNGGAEQKWFFDPVHATDGSVYGYMIRNDNSGLCIWTDDHPGDTVLQEPCNSSSRQDLWIWDRPDAADNFITNSDTGYALDVSGFSYNQGANIDTWYFNNQGNQDFWVTPTSS